MMVYRLTAARYAGDLSGEGAGRYGGRWNSKGVRMIYTSGSMALSMCELAVHLPLGILPGDYMMTGLLLPDDTGIKELNKNELPVNWFQLPFHHATQKVGDDFIQEMRWAVLKVPSALVRKEFNFLLNPLHPEFGRIGIAMTEPFTFDPRMFIR